MGTVLLTGATGRLGLLVASELASKGEKVRAVVRPSSKASALPGKVETFVHDLGKASLPKAAFEDVQKVIHLAGLVGQHGRVSLFEANAFSVQALLENCPSEVESVVIASSISVYGHHPGKLVDESFPTRPYNDYGASKHLGEMFAKRYCSTHPICILRLGMIYGPSFEEGYFEVLERLSLGKMPIIGSGKNRIPLLHQSDAVRAILLASDSAKRHPCREYNIVGQEAPTQEELLSLAASFLSVEPPKRHVPVLAAKAWALASSLLFLLGISKSKPLSLENIDQISSDRAYSCERAKRELGFEAKVKLDDGMKEVVEAFNAKRQKKVG
jgi:nucleoside-diphosphate-sugar epimerase